MTVFEAMILGMVQGLTEFLPISSSGHLLFMEKFLGLDPAIRGAKLTFNVAVHFGTLCAIVIFLRKKIYQIFSGLKPFNIHQNPQVRIIYLIIIGSLPTAFIGFLIKVKGLSLLNNIIFAAVMLLVTGALLFAADHVRGLASDRMPARRSPCLAGRRVGAGGDILGWNTYHALLVGTMQGLSVFPGLSRSGATITTAMFAGSSRQTAFEFSFLLSIPAILGANILQIKDIQVAISGGELVSTLVGTLTAFGVGWCALSILKWVLNRAKLHIFAWYCWALGTVILLHKAILG